MHKYLNTTHRAIAWFKKSDDAGELEIKPPFQRNPVWSGRQKSSLIDTILLELPIPELYMQEMTDANGQQTHVLVDGQQRIRAVLGFIAGDFDIEDDTSTWDGFSFDDLTADDKKRIFEYSFVVRLLPAMSDDQIRAIFSRLNKNTTVLNAQELRHATYWGPFIRLMEELSDLEFWNSASIFSPNDRRRMLDTEFVSELSVAILNGLQNKKKKLEDFYQLYEEDFEEASNLRSLFVTVTGEIEQILPELAKTRWRKKSDFYSLFVHFSQYLRSLPLSLQAREKARSLLIQFGQTVDSINRDGEASEPNMLAQDYQRNVEKAASDLGSRKERDRVLAELLKEIFPNQPTRAT